MLYFVQLSLGAWMPRHTSPTQRVYEIAEEQYGYFTTRQASDAGVDPRSVVMMARRGAAERVSRGVYRFRRFPESAYGQYMHAILWPHGVLGVISHESALALYGMSDVNPPKVHITVPQGHRVRRRVPQFLVIHRTDLNRKEIDTVEGLRTTSPMRTIRDCAEEHLSRALLRQAITDGRRIGRLTASEARALESELFGSDDGRSRS
jgi:predicted transcriptional regulator of viral defense system